MCPSPPSPRPCSLGFLVLFPTIPERSITMRIHITLGTVDSHYPIDARTAQQVIDRPDHIFHAANRIEDLARDVDNLDHVNAHNPALADLLTKVRYDIDQFQLPSMSPGDNFELRDSNGYLIGKWDCKSTGWASFVNRELLDIEVNVIA